MADLFPPSLEQQIAELKRELRQREHVYPRFVSAGKLTQQKADLQTRHLQAAIDTLEALKDRRV